MHVKILGSAAGGGFPQWNCACSNCLSLRNGTFAGKPRTQLQVAVSGNAKTWFLLNGSPDIRSQIEADPAFYPISGLRATPIAGVVLTSADLDQTLGLLALREFQSFRIYATPSIQRILREDNTIFSMLNRVREQVNWVDIALGTAFSLQSCHGESSGLCCSAVSLQTSSRTSQYPKFVSIQRAAELSPHEALLGLTVEASSGKRLGYFPAVPQIDENFVNELSALSLDVLLFDGTFWANDELQQIVKNGPTSQEIGHVPISGCDGSLQALASLGGTRKIFVHMNNTNPMLNESGPEYRETLAAGWEVAEDGWQFIL